MSTSGPACCTERGRHITGLWQTNVQEEVCRWSISERITLSINLCHNNLPTKSSVMNANWKIAYHALQAVPTCPLTVTQGFDLTKAQYNWKKRPPGRLILEDLQTPHPHKQETRGLDTIWVTSFSPSWLLLVFREKYCSKERFEKNAEIIKKESWAITGLLTPLVLPAGLYNTESIGVWWVYDCKG